MNNEKTIQVFETRIIAFKEKYPAYFGHFLNLAIAMLGLEEIVNNPSRFIKKIGEGFEILPSKINRELKHNEVQVAELYIIINDFKNALYLFTQVDKKTQDEIVQNFIQHQNKENVGTLKQWLIDQFGEGEKLQELDADLLSIGTSHTKEYILLRINISEEDIKDSIRKYVFSTEGRDISFTERGMQYADNEVFFGTLTHHPQRILISVADIKTLA